MATMSEKRIVEVHHRDPSTGGAGRNVADVRTRASADDIEALEIRVTLDRTTSDGSWSPARSARRIGDDKSRKIDGDRDRCGRWRTPRGFGQGHARWSATSFVLDGKRHKVAAFGFDPD